MLKSISQVRLENVERLMQSTGLSRKDFSEKSNIAYAQFGQYFGNIPQKNIGDNIARRIETAFELDQFWLDQNWGNETTANVGNISIGGSNTGMIGGQGNTQHNYVTHQMSHVEAVLDEVEANYYKPMPLLDLNTGVRHALDPNPATTITDGQQKILAFIPHTEQTFGVQLSHDIDGITPSRLLRHDTLIVEPCIRPQDNDLVLVCLDYDKPIRRGLIARLSIGVVDGKPYIKHDSTDPIAMPPNSLVCGVVVAIKRRTMENHILINRLEPTYDILSTLVTE